MTSQTRVSARIGGRYGKSRKCNHNHTHNHHNHNRHNRNRNQSRRIMAGGAFAAVKEYFGVVSIPLQILNAKRSGQDLIHNVNQIHKFYEYCAAMNVSTIECVPLRKRFTNALAELRKYMDFIIRSAIPIKYVAYAQGRIFGGNDNVLKDIEDINKLITETGVAPPTFMSKISSMLSTLTDIGMITMFADWYRYELYILATNLNTIMSEIVHSNITLQCAITRDLIDKTGKLITASKAAVSKTAATAAAAASRSSALPNASSQRFKRGDFRVLTLLGDK
jgi:hypothetical protein